VSRQHALRTRALVPPSTTRDGDRFPVRGGLLDGWRDGKVIRGPTVLRSDGGATSARTLRSGAVRRFEWTTQREIGRRNQGRNYPHERPKP